MISSDKPNPPAEAVKWRVPDLHPEGRKYVAIALLIAFLAWVFVPVLTWPLLGLALWVALFFRDPVRVTPSGEGLIISPADGLVSMIERVPVPRELAGPNGLGDAPLIRVSVFMSVFDVHINRTPIAGTVKQVVYISGKFVNAELDKASEENERRSLVIATPTGIEFAVVQIAGLVARRIVTFVREGDNIGIGERFGLIRFGSRVDTYLPPGRGTLVAVGQRAIGGETIFADLRSDEPEREARVQ